MSKLLRSGREAKGEGWGGPGAAGLVCRWLPAAEKLGGHHWFAHVWLRKINLAKILSGNQRGKAGDWLGQKKRIMEGWIWVLGSIRRPKRS